MPIQPSILDMIRSEVERTEPEPPPTRERALTPTIRWDYDYTRDEPPVVQRHTDEPRHSTPRADQRTPIECPRPALELPRPRASSAPPTSHPAKRMALNYIPVTEEITPPITPPRAQTREIDTATETVPETPSPTPKPGRSRGRGTWRAPQKIAPGVGTRSKTRAAELEKRNNAQAQAAHARWPPSPDATAGIQKLTRELHISDVPRNVHKELQRVLPSVEEEEIIQIPRQPPAAGLMTRHQDTYYIPPPRAVGGARGSSAPVSTATLGLIQRQDPSLAVQLREDPASMMTQATRHRVYSTMRLIRAGMLGQMASLQQWEEAMRRQDELHWKRCLVYIDDILVFGNDFESALHSLELVLTRVAEYGLQLKSTKCNLFRTSVPFLGHIVGRAGLECDPNKVSAVANWIRPSMIKGVR